jgi:hypothetical protein
MDQDREPPRRGPHGLIVLLGLIIALPIGIAVAPLTPHRSYTDFRRDVEAETFSFGTMIVQWAVVFVILLEWAAVGWGSARAPWEAFSRPRPRHCRSPPCPR